ncbi:DUF4878 domain-containing protein [Aneurinibacillus tyrosinisolvens]|uniref:DUF4878 domain-containing protein n=1 Tax=Aneurinibacillus tyrosinisolvens TaxID=1443435 RepID=UPI00063F1BA2|nr:DUF4878 domain-containing protein [Aneurinibacillus tyrosinisolvens]
MLLQKRWMLILSLVGVLLLFVGCSNQNTSNNDGPSPEAVTKMFFDALQKGDIEQAASLTQEKDMKKTLQEFASDPQGKEIATLYLQQLKYEVGSPDINGKEASVPVKITVPGAAKIAGAVAKEAMSGVLDGKSDSNIEKSALESIKQVIKNPATPKSTHNSSVTLVKTDTGWTIKSTDIGFLSSIHF